MRALAAIRYPAVLQCPGPLLCRAAVSSRNACDRRSVRGRRIVAAHGRLVANRRRSSSHRMGHFGGVVETHHRGSRHLDRRHLVAHPSAWRLHPGGLFRPGNHAAISAAQGWPTRTGIAARSHRRLGRHRRQQFRIGHAVQPVHTDILFRQRIRRPSRERRLAARIRRHRTDRLSDSDQIILRRAKHSNSPGSGLPRPFNTACPI